MDCHSSWRLLLATICVLLVTALTGCKGVPALIVKDTTSAGSSRAYVDFYTTNFATRELFMPNTPSGIWKIDDSGKAKAMGTIGCKAGERPAPIVIGDWAERLRVIVTPGQHKFGVGWYKKWQVVSVNASPDMVTPVEVNGRIRYDAITLTQTRTWEAIPHPPIPFQEGDALISGPASPRR